MPPVSILTMTKGQKRQKPVKGIKKDAGDGNRPEIVKS